MFTQFSYIHLPMCLDLHPSKLRCIKLVCWCDSQAKFRPDKVFPVHDCIKNELLLLHFCPIFFLLFALFHSTSFTCLPCPILQLSLTILHYKECCVASKFWIKALMNSKKLASKCSLPLPNDPLSLLWLSVFVFSIPTEGPFLFLFKFCSRSELCNIALFV